MNAERDWLFAYGSLVNDKTWEVAADAKLVVVSDWVRQWRHCVLTPFGSVCGLTIQPNEGTEIAGLAFTVSPEDWAYLDKREIGYTRIRLPSAQGGRNGEPVFSYSTAGAALTWASSEYPILQSYVDCVLDGYFRQFGLTGLRAFISSTQGWNLPTIADRDAPIYPRAQALPDERLALFDAELRPARAAETNSVQNSRWADV